jgi:SAM-dependent methyltransferase
MASLTEGDTLVDIGSYYPNKYLRGKDVIGIDLKFPEELCESYTGYKILDLNKHKLKFKKESVDTVVMGNVLEHVENPSDVLRQINKMLKKDGKLVLSIPNATFWWAIVHNILYKFIRDQDVGVHLNSWGKLDLIRLLKVNGFEVENVYGANLCFPFCPSWLNIGVYFFHTLAFELVYEAKKVSEV